MNDVDSLSADGFGHWLAGLIDGEGSFVIARAGKGYSCWMVVRLRDDDQDVLAMIRERTGLGALAAEKRTFQSSRPGANPSALWGVYSKADCLALAALLERYPLRGKKARDFVVWRWALAAWTQTQGPKRWTEMAVLKERLSAGRRYGGDAADLVAMERNGDDYAAAALHRVIDAERQCLPMGVGR